MIKKAAAELERELKPDKNLVSIGIDEHSKTLYIYTKRRRIGYPSEYKGFPVVVKQVGYTEIASEQIKPRVRRKWSGEV